MMILLLIPTYTITTTGIIFICIVINIICIEQRLVLTLNPNRRPAQRLAFTVKSTEGISEIWFFEPFSRWGSNRFRVRVRFTSGSEFARAESEPPRLSYSGFDGKRFSFIWGFCARINPTFTPPPIRPSPAGERARHHQCPRTSMGAGVCAGPSWPSLKA